MLLYSFARFILNIIINLLFKINVNGIENFPDKSAVIIYSNHKSNWDPVIMCCVSKRPICFMAKKELFDIPVLGFIFRKINAFPVNRGTPDRKAIKKALNILDENKVLGIFPEGTRNKGDAPTEPEPGIAYLAVKSKDTVLLPVAISSNYKFFSSIDIIIGKPQKCSTLAQNKRINSQKLKQISVEIFDEVSKLIAN